MSIRKGNAGNFEGMSRDEFEVVLAERIQEQNPSMRLTSWNELEGSPYLVVRYDYDESDRRLGWFPAEEPLLCDREGNILRMKTNGMGAYVISDLDADDRSPVRTWVFADPDFTRCVGVFPVGERECDSVFRSNADSARLFVMFCKRAGASCGRESERFLKGWLGEACQRTADFLVTRQEDRARQEAEKGFLMFTPNEKYRLVRDAIAEGSISVDAFKQACLKARGLGKARRNGLGV